MPLYVFTTFLERQLPRFHTTAMVHLRINEREPNPNPHVNFITVLPMDDSIVEEAARQLLRALAAQVKPIMKTHGFVVNSLEEVRSITSETRTSSGLTRTLLVRV